MHNHEIRTIMRFLRVDQVFLALIASSAVGLWPSSSRLSDEASGVAQSAAAGAKLEMSDQLDRYLANAG